MLQLVRHFVNNFIELQQTCVGGEILMFPNRIGVAKLKLDDELLK